MCPLKQTSEITKTCFRGNFMSKSSHTGEWFAYIAG